MIAKLELAKRGYFGRHKKYKFKGSKYVGN